MPYSLNSESVAHINLSHFAPYAEQFVDMSLAAAFKISNDKCSSDHRAQSLPYYMHTIVLCNYKSVDKHEEEGEIIFINSDVNLAIGDNIN